MFKIGEYVIHPRHGAGQVTDIISLTVCKEDRDCFIINPLLDDLFIKVPIDAIEAVGLRYPMSRIELQEHLEFLKEPLVDDAFLRTSKIVEEITMSDPMSVLNVIKCLFYEKIQRQQEGGNLSLSKRRMYSIAISLFATEIVATHRCSLDDACFEVRKSLVFHPHCCYPK